MTKKDLLENVKTVYIMLGVVAGLLWAGFVAYFGAPRWVSIVIAIIVALAVAVFSVAVERAESESDQ